MKAYYNSTCVGVLRHIKRLLELNKWICYIIIWYIKVYALFVEVYKTQVKWCIMVYTQHQVIQKCANMYQELSHIKVYKCIFIVSIAIYKVHVSIWRCIKGI